MRVYISRVPDKSESPIYNYVFDKPKERIEMAKNDLRFHMGTYYYVTVESLEDGDTIGTIKLS